MLNCNYTEFNEIISFGTVAGEKYNPAKTTLQNIIDRIALSFDQYLNSFHTLEGKENSDILITEVDEKAALKSCYTSETESFKIIRGRIFDIQPNSLKAFCPYCLLNKPKTLDHYIGQTEFPEYAILQRNLVPCCFDCNQSKGEHWRQNNTRRFIHFYNDNFLNHKFLNAELVFNDGQTVPNINFSLLKPVAMNANDFSIVEFHFEDLDLINLYNERANTLMSSEITVITDSHNGGATDTQIIASLIKRAEALSADFGVNYWSSVMYQTLATNNNLINLIALV